MVGRWAKGGAFIGLLVGLKEGGMAIVLGPFMCAIIGASIRRWILAKFGI